MSWRILIERGNLEFSAAHFITFGGKCEPLHGHNYGVRVEAEGALTTDSYVFDFVVLKDIVRTLIKDWDHRFLLPTRSPHLRVTERDDAWDLEYDAQTRYTLPRSAVVPSGSRRRRCRPRSTRSISWLASRNSRRARPAVRRAMLLAGNLPM
jgi:6-pyruvoyl tetrahydropterin synthase/QueD family protein